MSPEVAEVEVWPLAGAFFGVETESSSAVLVGPLSCLVGLRYLAGDPGKDLFLQKPLAPAIKRAVLYYVLDGSGKEIRVRFGARKLPHYLLIDQSCEVC